MKPWSYTELARMVIVSTYSRNRDKLKVLTGYDSRPEHCSAETTARNRSVHSVVPYTESFAPQKRGLELRSLRETRTKGDSLGSLRELYELV